jgi:hypothetical protein
MIILAIVAAGAVALGLGAYFFRGRSRQDSPTVCRAHCPRCDQRVRYGEERAGMQIACPRCRRRWTLPGATASIPATSAA